MYQASANVKNSLGKSAFFLACEGGNRAMLKLLLAADANPNMAGENLNYAYIHIPLALGSSECIVIHTTAIDLHIYTCRIELKCCYIHILSRR